jgi:hypothetical protein
LHATERRNADDRLIRSDSSNTAGSHSLGSRAKFAAGVVHEDVEATDIGRQRVDRCRISNVERPIRERRQVVRVVAPRSRGGR